MPRLPERSKGMIERRSPHSVGHRLARLIWGIVQATVFRYSPRNFHRWRNMLLRLFGASLHSKARVYPRARIWGPWNLTMDEGATIGDDVDVYSVAAVHLEAWVVVSQYCYLCAATHEFEDVQFPLVPMPITIGRRAWIAADVFIGPGVTIGAGTVVGARSSVFKDLEAWIVAAGSPAKKIRDRTLQPEDYGE